MHKGARTDPCGGRGVTRVPTATRSGINLTWFGYGAYSTKRRGRPFHHGTATGLSMRPEASTIGK